MIYETWLFLLIIFEQLVIKARGRINYLGVCGLLESCRICGCQLCQDRLNHVSAILKFVIDCYIFLNICSILQVCITQHQKDQALSNRACCATSVQAHVISWLDYCNALLAGLPLSTIKPLQMMIQNAAARLVFNGPKRAHVTPLFISFHWLPVAGRIKFKTLMLTYRTTTGSAPAYFHSLMTIYIPSRSLRSASERHLMVPSQRGSKSISRTFWFTTSGWWNDLPTHIRNAGSLLPFKQQLKTHLFRHYLTSS